jgi:diguanylate cyclase (GGDEF)-like protein/PAS domain S-box-containing protein
VKRVPQSRGLSRKKSTPANTAPRVRSLPATELLRDIATHVAADTAPEFFPSLVRFLVRTLGASEGYIAEVLDAGNARVRTIVRYADGKIAANVERASAKGALAQVLHHGMTVCRTGACKQFPQDQDLTAQKAEFYVGTPLFGANGECIGLLAAGSSAPLAAGVNVEELVTMLAVRAAPVLQRRLHEERAPRLHRLLHCLRVMKQAIGNATDGDGICAEVCRLLVEHGGFQMVWIGLLQAAGDVQPVAYAGISGDYFDGARLRGDNDARNHGPTVVALQTGRSAICPDVDAEAQAPWAKAVRKFAGRSCAAFPLREHGRVVGVLTLYAAVPSAFGTAESALLESFADDLSRARQGPDPLSSLRHARDELAETLRRFSTLLSNLPGMVYRCRNDRDWTMEFVSDGCLALTGYPPSDFIENRLRSYAQIIAPEDRERVWEESQRALAARVPSQLEYRIRTADGAEKWVWEQGREVYDSNGELIAIEGFITDISERRRAEQALRASEERFKSLTELSSDWYWEQDAELRFTLITHNVESAGRPLSALSIGRQRWELPFYREMTEADWAPLKALLEARAPFQNFLLKRRGVNGEQYFNVVSGVPIFDANGGFKGYRGTGHDITKRMRADEEMRKLSSAIQQIADSVIITSRDGVIEYVNAAFEQVTGYERGQALGRNASLIKSGLHEPRFYDHMWQRLLSGETFRDVFINRKRNGEMYYEEKTISPLRDGAGEITHFIATGKDITDRMQTQERLHHLAHYDALTDLPNRALFLERLNQALARAHWNQRVVAVMFLDLDRFKYINDTLGHDVGDAFLKMLAARLQARLRDGDSVARLGGDEFAVLAEDMAHAEDVALLAAKLLDGLSLPFVVQQRELYVTASIGISLYPNDGTSAAALVKNADTAMYRAKDVGKNNYQFYSADMGAAALERLTLETSLRRALERHEFLLCYQPQVELATGRLVGVEALVRWQHPEFGLLGPTQFIGLAEETGAIVAIGEWVLRAAMAQTQAWRVAGDAGLRVSVNVSGRQFTEPGFLETVGRALADTGLPATALELEITESVIMQNAENMVERLRALHAMGVRFAIDDFGTGYSSLSYLRRFPIHTLKIDKSFIGDLTGDSGDAEIAKTIMAMARNLKLAVIAEGLQTPEQLTFLRAQGCYAAQGFLIARPMSVEQLTERLGRELPWLLQ